VIVAINAAGRPARLPSAIRALGAGG